MRMLGEIGNALNCCKISVCPFLLFLDPVKSSDCRSFPTLAQDEEYPENTVVVENLVGLSDAPSDQDSQLEK